MDATARASLSSTLQFQIVEDTPPSARNSSGFPYQSLLFLCHSAMDAAQGIMLDMYYIEYVIDVLLNSGQIC